MQQRQQKRSSGRIAEGFQGVSFFPQNNILLLSSIKICGREREREAEGFFKANRASKTLDSCSSISSEGTYIVEKKLERRGMQAVKDLNHHDDHCSELLRSSSNSLHSWLLDMQQILLSFCFPACTTCPTKEGGRALVTSTTTSCSFWSSNELTKALGGILPGSFTVEGAGLLREI